MIYDFLARTDIGLLRKNNEDSVAFDTASGVAVLADGMGGYNGGEVASDMATAMIVTELGDWFAQAPPQIRNGDVKQALEASVAHANHAILASARANFELAGMGTTLVAGVFRGQTLTLGHIGDSRCYRWRQRILTRLTRDHSLLQEQLDAGLITPAQAAVSGNRNLVTRALGVDEAALLEVHEHLVQPGDLYLLCSDGLTDMVDDEALAALLDSGGSAKELAIRLVENANACGGRDNISVLLVNAHESVAPQNFVARLLRK